MSDQFSMVAIIKLAVGNLEAFRAMMVDPNGIETTRSFPGNILFETTVDINDKNTIRIYEKWENKQSWDNYMKFRADSGFAAKLMALVAEAPQFFPVESIA